MTILRTLLKGFSDRSLLFVPGICLVLLPLLSYSPRAIVLENHHLALSFDRTTGSLVEIRNKLTKERYKVQGDEFSVEAIEFDAAFSDLKPVKLKSEGNSLVAYYKGLGLDAEVTWTLGKDRHFAEKRVALKADRGYGLKKVILSRPAFWGEGLNVVSYRYPQFGRPAGKEPISTFFGRTPKGGLFTGIEMPFDISALNEQKILLAYEPGIKVGANERVDCEPVYFGVYERHEGDDQTTASLLQFIEKARREFGSTSAGSGGNPVIPFRSESDAMASMTSAILGPPRHGLLAMVNGWHSEMQHEAYTSDAMVEAEIASLDFIAECGFDWVTASHPWGGEIEKMNALGADDKYTPGERVEKFLKHAQKKNLRIMMWPTMNHTHPWSKTGAPFRPDKPEWLMMPGDLSDKPKFVKEKAGKANCFAHTPFFNWLSRVNNDALATGYYPAWCMDGSFFGDGGWYTSVVPVDCASDGHDHLPGNSNYVSQRALDRLISDVRQRHPNELIEMCRPPMDLGVWSFRNVDVCFTQLEDGTGMDHIAAGDNIRTWSRARVHLDFFPHYLDQPLLFSSRYIDDKRPYIWSGEKLDYIMLSGMSSAPSQLYYLPTKTGIPDKDKAELRKWLDWGREHIDFLKVRKDLSDWPAPGKVDGSAHIIGDKGLIFLFNPGKEAMQGTFKLTDKEIGLKGEGNFKVSQQYPVSANATTAEYGETIRWEVPAETALILEIIPVSNNE